MARAKDHAPRWIEDYRAVTMAQSGEAPPGMPAAFVLQYLLDPLATVMATAAKRTPFALDADPALWSLDLDPTYLYPTAVQIRIGDHLRIEDEQDRVNLAQSRYTATATQIATELPTPTKMSSQQRLGMVMDMWHGALARVHGAAPPERQSCCLMYALPGCQPCAGCPRRG